MFDHLFRYGKIIDRHRQAPFVVERERFLQNCAGQGMAKTTLTSLATELLVVVQRIDLAANNKPVTSQQIHAAAERWACHQRRRGRSHGVRWSRERFVQVATAWLKFIDRLEIGEPKYVPGERWIKLFLEYSLNERGLSIHSVRFDSHHMGKFFEWLAAQHRTLARCRLKDVDAFVESLKQKGWCRVSIARSVEALRAFFRYAEHSGWCTTGIAAGIERPRLYRDEGLPVGPDWSDVQRLICYCNEGPRPQDIRDKAILELLAIYGLRAGEVTRLRLEDLNWSQDRILVTRSKQRRSHEYPLLPCVGESILRYLQKSRPRCGYREVFLTSKAPVRPLSSSALSTMVSERFRALNIRSLRSGAHALRHACAGRLIAQGLSLKQIGDHLGHRSAYSTRTYAKVDLAGLREVADLSLGGLL